MKKIGMIAALAAGIGGAVLAAPTANASSTPAGADLTQRAGCFYNNQWYDICPSIDTRHDNDRDRRDRRRDRDHDHDHGDHH